LDDEPTCGTYTPKVFSNLGLIPVATSVSISPIACTIDRMSAFVSELNVLGDEVLTLHGSNLPKSLDNTENSIKIIFSDTQGTLC